MNPTLFNHLKWTTISRVDRPDRTLSEAEKNTEKYAVDCGRYCLSEHEGMYSDWFRFMGSINVGFATEQLWGMPEDKEMYLMDRGMTTTRRALRSPLIRPMLTRMVGQLGKLAIHARASYSTQKVNSRREDVLKQAALFARAARAGGSMANAMMTARGVNGNEEQAMKMADVSFQDQFLRPTNALINSIAQYTNIEGFRRQIGEQIGCTGLAAMHMYPQGLHLGWELLNYDEILWDTNARRADMSDGEYVGFLRNMNIAELCERYDAKADVLRELDRLTKSPQSRDQYSDWSGGIPKVAQVYYKDVRYDLMGFIEGPNGPEMVSLDEKDPSTGKPRYTMNDIMRTPPGIAITKGWTGNTDRRCVSYAREVTFIPWEFQPTMKTRVDGNDERKPQDIVLKHGVCQLQEAAPMDAYGVALPIKLTTWSMLNGWIIAPISAAQGPQRIINQVTSDITWRMSKNKGASRLIDKTAVTSAGMSVASAQMAMKEGDDVFINGSHLGGLQNSVKELGSGVDSGIYEQFNTLQQLAALGENATGVFKENFGAPEGQAKLVGVKRMQEQQSNIMFQPVIDAVQRLYEQVHQANAQVGRQWYVELPWLLEDFVGKDGADVLIAAKDIQLEQIRVQVKISENAEEIMQLTDEYALAMLNLPIPLLDDVSVGELLGQSYPEDLFAKVRDFTKRRRMQQEEQAQAQAEAQQLAALDQEDMMAQEQERELYNKTVDATLDMAKVDQKANQPNVQAISEHLKPQPIA